MSSGQLTIPEPSARRTDPDTSHDAARVARRGSERLRREIRRWFAANGPASQADCADVLSRHGWDWRTVVTACNPKRSGLEVVARGRHTDEDGLPVGAPFNLYALPIESVPGL